MLPAVGSAQGQGQVATRMRVNAPDCYTEAFVQIDRVGLLFVYFEWFFLEYNPASGISESG